jgi:2-succinyl-5-enolpyruvyl-6-hydroxy-3-cyclohexene-1-carboxylate synthase
VVGSSNPTRDVALAGTLRPDVLVHRNRGVAGIDGTVSTAIGAATVHRAPSYALLGDLTFLHDASGLLTGPAEQRPDLTIVVLNDDGGGIFSLLEQGAPEHADSFERVFGTPHGADLGALCAGYRVPHVVATSVPEFRAALKPAPGLRVVEVRVDRSRHRDLHARLRKAVAAAVGNG